MKRFGFTPQKPVKRAYEQNPKAVQRWLDDAYPLIAKRAKEEGVGIHWEMHRVKEDTGDPLFGQATAHQSDLLDQGKLRFMTRLIRDRPQKIFLVLDNLRVHHSKKVKAWLASHQEKIEVFHLPAYSPEMNPDEYLNCDLKAGVHSAPPTRAKGDLKRKTIAHLRRVQKLPNRVRSYFQHPKIAYAA